MAFVPPPPVSIPVPQTDTSPRSTLSPYDAFSHHDPNITGATTLPRLSPSPSQASEGQPTGWAWVCDRPGCVKAYARESSLIKHIQSVQCVPHIDDQAVSKDELMPTDSDAASDSTCQACGKVCRNKKALVQHRASHTPDDQRPFRCDWEGCSKGFARKDHYVRHRRTHTGERLFACGVATCGKTFVQKEALKVHMRRHTGERPFTCDICDKSFNDRSGLHHHRGRHLDPNERPFRCDWPGCEKAYHARYALNSHAKLHSEVKASRRSSATTMPSSSHSSTPLNVGAASTPTALTDCCGGSN